MPDAQKPAPQAKSTETTTAAPAQPTAVRGLQAGEEVAGRTTTRVPRGVSEPPADLVSDEPGVRALQEVVQKAEDEAVAKGFRGTQVDTTPNENYTLRGVGQGLPTPETAVFTPRQR